MKKTAILIIFFNSNDKLRKSNFGRKKSRYFDDLFKSISPSRGFKILNTEKEIYAKIARKF
ncbi:hypothetical protein BpHYR1_013896 [Brachionus plicatilis]|uniref:Uncharacterized protein n=1 Tax=Brachionus plicatilis TaxID=10195 RepID=A0A3M7RJW1_BRAPC|nr:hypothetical protein BpHYR1_013896 [Brachionus plicatilis]